MGSLSWDLPLLQGPFSKKELGDVLQDGDIICSITSLGKDYTAYGWVSLGLNRVILPQASIVVEGNKISESLFENMNGIKRDLVSLDHGYYVVGNVRTKEEFIDLVSEKHEDVRKALWHFIKPDEKLSWDIPSQELEVGCGVRIIGKSAPLYTPFAQWITFNSPKQNILRQDPEHIFYIVGRDKFKLIDHWIVNLSPKDDQGDYFRSEDLVLVEPKQSWDIPSQEIQVGSKVRIRGKSVPGFIEFEEWKRLHTVISDKYMVNPNHIFYVNGKNSTGEFWVVWYKPEESLGDFFRTEDLELVD